MKVQISCPPEFLSDTKLRDFLHETLKQYSLISPPHSIFYGNDRLTQLAYHLSDMLGLPCVLGPVDRENCWIYLEEGRKYAERQGVAEVPLCLIQLEDLSMLNVPISSYHDYCEIHKGDDVTPSGHESQVIRGVESLMRPEEQQGIRVLAMYWSEVSNEQYIAFLTYILRGLGSHFDFCYPGNETAAIVSMMPGDLMTLQTVPEDYCSSGKAFLSMKGSMHWVLFCPYSLFQETAEASLLPEQPFILIQNSGRVKYYNYNDFKAFWEGQPAETRSPSIKASLDPATASQDPIQSPIRPLSSRNNRRVRRKGDPQGGKRRKFEAGGLEDDFDTKSIEVDKPSEVPTEPLRDPIPANQVEVTGMRVVVSCGENWTNQSDTDLAEFLRNWKVRFYVCDSNSQFEVVASKIGQYQIGKYAEGGWSSVDEFLGMQGPDNWVWLASSQVLKDIAWRYQWTAVPFLAYRIGNGDLQPYSKPQPPSSRPQSGYKRPIPSESLDGTLQFPKKAIALASHREQQLQTLAVYLQKSLNGVKWRVIHGQSVSATQNQAADLLNEFLDFVLKTCIAKLTELCIQMQTWLRDYEEMLLRKLMEPMTELYGLIAALHSQGLQEAFLRLSQYKQAFEASYSDPSIRQEIDALVTDEAPLINTLYYTVEQPHYNYSLLPARLRSCPYLIVRIKRPTGQNVLLTIQTNPYTHITTHNRLFLEQEVLFVPLPLKPGEAFNLRLLENEAQVSKEVTLRYDEFEAMEDLDWDGEAEQFAQNQHQNGA